jgi:hypothetical protein
LAIIPARTALHRTVGKSPKEKIIMLDAYGKRNNHFAGACLGLVLALAFTLGMAESADATTVLRNVTFNLTGHASFEDDHGAPWTEMTCQTTLTANSGTVQSHRAGLMAGNGGGLTAWGAFTTATVAYSPVTACRPPVEPILGEQSTSPSITRSYTLRLYAN